MTRAEISELVAILMACYPNARFSDGTALAYENFLIDLDRERAKQALRTVIRSSRFMPTIAEIVATYEQQRDVSQLTIPERMATDRLAANYDRAARGLPPLDDGREAIHDPAELDRILAGVVGSIG